MAFNLDTVSLSGATGTAGNAATGTGNVQELLDLQFSQGVELAKIQAQSGMIKNLTEALQNVARNVGG